MSGNLSAELLQRACELKIYVYSCRCLFV